MLSRVAGCDGVNAELKIGPPRIRGFRLGEALAHNSKARDVLPGLCLK
jgi:hypothetical protein